MDYQVTALYMLRGEAIAKQMMNEQFNGKAKAKKPSRIKAMFKKIAK